MRTVMPRARFVFIHRDLKDCLKSAKAQGLSYGASYSKADIEEFCRSGAENETYTSSLSAEPTVLSLQYEDLVRKPDATLRKLAEFTGIDDMEPSVLNHKVNTWVGEDSKMQSKDGYFEPIELDEYDWQMINSTRSPSIEQPRAS